MDAIKTIIAKYASTRGSISFSKYVLYKLLDKNLARFDENELVEQNICLESVLLSKYIESLNTDDDLEMINSLNSIIYFYVNYDEKLSKDIIKSLNEDNTQNKYRNLCQIVLDILKIWETSSYEEAEKCANDILNAILCLSFDIYYLKEKDQNTLLYQFIDFALELTITILKDNFPEVREIEGENEPRLVIYHWIGETLWRKEKYEIAIEYLKIAITNKCIDMRMDAYNLLSLCAIEIKEYQFAYDVYYSWINKNNIGLISHINTDFSGYDENIYSFDYDILEARIYSNMGYVCAMIADEYIDNDIKEKLIREALAYNEKAINLDKNRNCLINKTTYLYSLKHYQEALYVAEELNRFPTHTSAKLSSLRTIIELILEIICLDKEIDIEKEDLINKLFMYVDEYKIFYTKSNKSQIKDIDLENEIELARYLLNNCIEDEDSVIKENVIEKWNYDLSLMLLQIYTVSNLIREELKYPIVFPKKYNLYKDYLSLGLEQNLQEYPPIAYYTTLKNSEYLFNKINVTTNKEGLCISEDDKNCLTMMHAYYMNDPNEGLTLLETLSNYIEHDNKYSNLLFQSLSPVLFREKLYDSQFVFLKSFTSLVDRLNMWTMYASDREEKSDSNGCCVCVAPETFDLMEKSNYGSDRKQMQEKIENDDYNLYRVAYVDKNEILGSDDNSLLKDYFLKLKVLFYNLNSALIKYASKGINIDIDEIRRNLQHSVRFITFLFKDASYNAESEVRLIITRDSEATEQIKMTEQIPPKLFINPPHQIYVNQIILGPKVVDSDKWIPYYQYKLVDMWKSWPEKQYGKRKPSVRKSAINYRD